MYNDCRGFSLCKVKINWHRLAEVICALCAVPPRSRSFGLSLILSCLPEFLHCTLSLNKPPYNTARSHFRRFRNFSNNRDCFSSAVYTHLNLLLLEQLRIIYIHLIRWELLNFLD